MLSSMEPQWWDGTGRSAGWGHPFVRRHHVEPHPHDQVIRRHPGKVDAGEVACLTGATVGADKVLGRQIVSTIRTGDMYRDAVVMLVKTRQGVTPTNVCAVFAGDRKSVV